MTKKKGKKKRLVLEAESKEPEIADTDETQEEQPEESEPKNKKKKENSTRITTSYRAGILFPVGRIRTKLKKLNSVDKKVNRVGKM